MDEIYSRLDDEQSRDSYWMDGQFVVRRQDDAREDRSLLRGRVNMLFRDRPYHRRTALMMEEEARVSRVTWAQSMDASDKARDRQRLQRCWQRTIGDRIIEALKLLKKLQAQMTEFQRQQGPTNGPAQPEVPEEAGSSS
ncbi:hypothetical protein Tco_1264246 [Tanacetum coccineum]